MGKILAGNEGLIMKRCVYLLAFFIQFAYALDQEISSPPPYPSLETNKADWIFTGIVTNEQGESFHYYLEMQKNDKTYHAIASITEGESKKLMLYEQSEAVIDTPSTQWQVGRIFLTFNPINNTWLFGVKKEDHKGFQFKVDMLSETSKAQSPKPKDLRPGIKFSVNQTGLLNGYLQTGNEKDYFVTATKSWFQQVWTANQEGLDHTLVGVLCEFSNGNAFYAMNLKETDALQGAIAGWRNEQGESTPMSQFISIASEKENAWSIDLNSPKLHLNIQDLIPNHSDKKPVIIGASDGLAGFCSITENTIVG